MRYNHRLEIPVQEAVTRYNPEVGRHETVQEAITHIVPCHLSSMSMERSMQVFGDYKKDYLVARCKNKVPTNYHSVFVNEMEYKVVRTLHHRGRTDFYLEHVR